MSVYDELRMATRGWMLPFVVRSYADDQGGHARLQEEAGILANHGYNLHTQSQQGGHVHVGRILLTGGLSVLAGRSGIRSTGHLAVTFVRVSASIESVTASKSATLVEVDDWQPRGGYFDPSTGLRSGDLGTDTTENVASSTVETDEEPAPAGEEYGTEVTALLERLAALRRDGLLSDDEFRVAKARVLGGR